jgi:hypothetical protein
MSWGGNNENCGVFRENSRKTVLKTLKSGKVEDKETSYRSFALMSYWRLSCDEQTCKECKRAAQYSEKKYNYSLTPIISKSSAGVRQPAESLSSFGKINKQSRT